MEKTKSCNIEVHKAWLDVMQDKRKREKAGIIYVMGMRRDLNRKKDGYHEWTC